MINKKQIHIGLPCTGIEEIEAVKEPLTTGWLTQGPKVKQFEDDFAKHHNTLYASAVTSGTTALHLGLLALGVKEGDEVIVPSFTWVATANAAAYCGAKPVIVDCDLKTYNINPIEIKKAITRKTKAIIPVHLFGLCADMEEIKNSCGNIPLLEDAACAAGAKYKNHFAGGLGDIGTFSFHPRKTLTTGEGGMLTTSNPTFLEEINILRNHGGSISKEIKEQGMKPHLMLDYEVPGYNYRMTDLQAAVGIEQLKKLSGFIEERRKWAKFYEEKLAEVKWLKTPYVPPYAYHSYQSFVCFVEAEKAPYKRNEIMEILHKEGIATRPGTHAVHSLGLYKGEYNCPNAFALQESTMAIPLHNKMTEEDYEYVVNIIKKIK